MGQERTECDTLVKLTHFQYDSDDADGGVYVGNPDYGRFADIVDHINSCQVCQSNGWRGVIRLSDGHLWYGNIKDDERYNDQYVFNKMDNDEFLAKHPGFTPSYTSTPFDGKYHAGRSPNDQRSDVSNPTSQDHKAAADNRANQMNPNNQAYRSSRGKK